jgi:nitroreductase
MLFNFGRTNPTRPILAERTQHELRREKGQKWRDIPSRLGLKVELGDTAPDPRGAFHMDVFEAVSSRYSCRAFLPTPIPEKTVRDIVERAARAPSAGNMQPWRIYAVAGERVAQLKAFLKPRMASELPRGEGTDYTIYPEPLGEPYKTRRFRVGELLYQSIQVPREDKPARYKQYSRNFEFFGAPAALFFAREKAHGPAQWADIGGYLQTVCLLARGHGLHTCPQQAWVSFHKTVREFLQLPDHLMIYSGMALGFADETAPINGWRSPREPLEAFASFDGF